MTLTTALPTLLRLERKRAQLSAACGCRRLPHLHAMPDNVLDVPDLQWSHCPFDLVGSPFVSTLRGLSRMAKVSPLDGWPSRYSAWVVYGLLAMRDAEG